MDGFADRITHLKDFAGSLIGFIEAPSVEAKELADINDKVTEFFKLVNEANTADLGMQETTELYSIVSSFHKTVNKKYQQLNGKILMADERTITVNKEGGKNTTRQINETSEQAEGIWRRMLRWEKKEESTKKEFTEMDDKKLEEIFAKNGMGYIDSDFFIHSDAERNMRDIGYKLHVNVSENDMMGFLEEAIPLLGEEKTAFKIWKPSHIEGQTGSQQGKLITIYAQSRTEAIGVMSSLEPLLAKYAPGPMPPNEKQLNAYVSYRYADFSDELLHNPWNPKEVIGGEEGRAGKVAGWARGLEERPQLVSRSDVVDGTAKTGDVVALLDADGKYVPAELVDYRPTPYNPELTAQSVHLRPLAGTAAGKIIDKANLQNISRTPGEKSEELYFLERLLNHESRIVSRADVQGGHSKPGDIVALFNADGIYVPAVIIGGNSSGTNSISLNVLEPGKVLKPMTVEPDNLSRTPIEKLRPYLPENLIL